MSDEFYAAANRVLNTRDGELMYDELMKRYYDNPIKEDQLERQVGRRDVALELKRLKERKL